MHTTAQSAGSPPLVDHPSLESALQAFQWKAGRGQAWYKTTPSGRLELRTAQQSRYWRQFVLSGAGVATTTAGQYLHANAKVHGPLKYVVGPDGHTACRCDFPQPAADRDGELSMPAVTLGEPYEMQWVRAVTAWAAGHDTTESTRLELAELTGPLQELGRSVSCDGERLLVHVQQPGAFGQIRLENDDPRGYRLTADLLSLRDLSGRVRRAAVRLVSEANRRLPLVRFALRGGRPGCVCCEVSFGNALVPGVWLMVALETIETAMALTLRELHALRDPTLARLLSAVSTA